MQKKFRKYSISGALIITLLSGYAGYDIWLHQNTRVIVFDVGQGDSTLIRTASRHSILIDGGPDRSVLLKLGTYLPFYDHTIDLVILTHPHADHLVGLLEVMKRYEVKQVLYPNSEYGSQNYQTFLESIMNKEVFYGAAGQQFIFGEQVIEILYPFSGKRTSEENINNVSIVAKLVSGDDCVLFTGDIEREAEERLLGESIECRYLKVPHHGSNSSSTEAFINAVNPDIAVFSVGNNNRFNHPHQEVIKRYMEKGIKLHRTDREGDIVFSLSK